jgi:hypothetical protein
MDTHLLIKALNNEKNEFLFENTKEKIKNKVLTTLNQLLMSKELTNKYFLQLSNYRYVDDINELKIGGYLRWFSLLPKEEPSDEEPFKLSKGGHLCDILVKPNFVSIVCKNNFSKYFSFHFDECLVFQKISEQENILLNALEYLIK